VLGLLIDDGKASAQTLAKDHLPALGASYGSVTLAHFASMTSGYDGGGDQSSTPFSPTAPLFPPGSEFQYWDSAMNQFANVLTRINGARVDALFAQRVADPIGMDSGDWSWGDFGSVDGIVVNGGAGNKSKGIQISARQLARFGWLFLNRGRWQTAQLISQSWVDAASGVQVAASTPAHTNGSTGPGVYGYNWWVNGTLPGGMRRWPDAPADTFAALGYNHNRLYVVPGWNALVVRLGTDGTQPSDAETSEFFKLLADAGLGS
jgi:CubicO group peptidase (beta-lactamase class C family)